MASPLVAAAMVARDGRYSVTVVIPHAPQRVMEAGSAAEQAGVDLAVERMRSCATLHFVARHQDRRLPPSALPVRTLRSLVRAASLDEPKARTRGVASRAKPEACGCG